MYVCIPQRVRRRRRPSAGRTGWHPRVSGSESKAMAALQESNPGPHGQHRGGVTYHVDGAAADLGRFGGRRLRTSAP